MPCYEEHVSIYDVQRANARAAKAEAMLCAVLSAVHLAPPAVIRSTEDLIYLVDEVKSGVMKAEIRDWWQNRLFADRKRREREEKALREKRVRETALAKLTDEEREVLGIDRKSTS